MKRFLSLGLTLALIFSIAALSGCGQKSDGSSSESGAGSAASSSTSSSADTSAGEGKKPTISGGAAQASGSGDSTGTADANGDADAAALTTVHTQEYGTCTNYDSDENNIKLRLNYPDGDIDALDNAFLDWAKQTAADYQNEQGGSDVAVSLAASYDSFNVNDRVVSLVGTASLNHSHSALPETKMTTFNADRETGKLLNFKDLLKDGGETAIRQLCADAGLDSTRTDLFDNWLLTAAGLRLYLDGEQAVEFTYSQLRGMLTVPKPPRKIDPSKPMIALTFDDGPSKNTEHILDLLEEYDVRATFFVVGNRVSTYADTAKRAVALGNEIGIHTWEHAKLTVLSPDEIASQITRTADAVKEYAGGTCAAVRPPGGACDDTVKQVAGQLGYILVNWSIDTLDWKTRDADSTYNAIMSQAADGGIVLCHDLYESTANAMDRVIPELIDQGYQLVTVSELLSYNTGGVTPGNLYSQRK